MNKLSGQHDKLVSVVMSVYNGQKYLSEAIESILNQTYTNFEFIIIDDGSTDNSLEIVQKYAKEDDRIRVIVNEKNIGLAKSLNKGIALARGEYIARMDADDVSLPERFEKQVSFFKSNSNVGLLGTNIKVFSQVDHRLHTHRSYPLDDLDIRWFMFFSPPFCHPTVMFRHSLVHKVEFFYSDHFLTAQDYELWSRLLLHTSSSNLKEALLIYRIHDNQTTESKRKSQLENHKIISHKYINTILPKVNISIEEVDEILQLFCKGYSVSKDNGNFRNDAIKNYVRVYFGFIKRYGPLQKGWAHDKVIYKALKLLSSRPRKINDFFLIFSTITTYFFIRLKLIVRNWCVR